MEPQDRFELHDLRGRPQAWCVHNRPTMLEPDPESDRILVVEDDKVTREALVMLLEYEGYEIRSAGGGDEAMTMLDDWTPDVVVSDVNMQKGDGFTLVPALRRRSECRDAAIILVSARDDIDRRVNGLNLGADDFLSKPVDPEELLARIRAHLRAATRRKDLQQSSVTDACTGLLNRRGLEESLEHEFQRAERGSVFSILMFDLDNFKAVNDEHGHAIGDAVLQQVGKNLAAAGRSVDRFGRWGGDEFVILLNGCSAEVLCDTLARFRERLEGSMTTEEGVELAIQCSMGGTTYRPGTSPKQLLEEADAAMYLDKRKRQEAAASTSAQAPS